MKNLVKLFTVIALLAIGFSASAQDAGTSGAPYVVNNSSTRVFTVDLHAGSVYVWSVLEGPSDGFTLNGALNVATITWSKVGVYKIRVVETNELGCSSDDNIKEYWVSVQTNNFKVTPSWDLKANDLVTACAISGDNTVRFTLTKEGGKDAAWRYKYKVTQIYEGGTSTVIVLPTEGNVTSGLTTVIDVITTIVAGEGNCTIKFELLEAYDFYNTPNSNPIADNVVDAIVHQIPATGDITID